MGERHIDPRSLSLQGRLADRHRAINDRSCRWLHPAPGSVWRVCGDSVPGAGRNRQANGERRGHGYPEHGEPHSGKTKSSVTVSPCETANRWTGIRTPRLIATTASAPGDRPASRYRPPESVLSPARARARRLRSRGADGEPTGPPVRPEPGAPMLAGCDRTFTRTVIARSPDPAAEVTAPLRLAPRIPGTSGSTRTSLTRRPYCGSIRCPRLRWIAALNRLLPRPLQSDRNRQTARES